MLAYRPVDQINTVKEVDNVNGQPVVGILARGEFHHLKIEVKFYSNLNRAAQKLQKNTIWKSYLGISIQKYGA